MSLYGVVSLLYLAFLSGKFGFFVLFPYLCIVIRHIESTYNDSREIIRVFEAKEYMYIIMQFM